MILEILHAVIAILLTIAITIQQRSSGLSSAISGQMGSTNVVQRRGAELFVYRLTIWLSIAFFVIAIVRWYI
jgi:protein translocase SecG subunit